MPYATLAQLKAYLLAGGQVPPTTDDTNLLTPLLTRAQKIVETITGRTFESRTETRLFDVPRTRQLEMDDDLLTVTTLTNGDGAVIAASDYNLIPNNHSPKYAIRLKQSSTASWMPGSGGDTERVISVAGTWGYASDAPDDIRHATIRLAHWLYKQKDSVSDLDRPALAPSGFVILPMKIPHDVMSILDDRRRRL